MLGAAPAARFRSGQYNPPGPPLRRAFVRQPRSAL